MGGPDAADGRAAGSARQLGGRFAPGGRGQPTALAKLPAQSRELPGEAGAQGHRRGLPPGVRALWQLRADGTALAVRCLPVRGRDGSPPPPARSAPPRGAGSAGDVPLGGVAHGSYSFTIRHLRFALGGPFRPRNGALDRPTALFVNHIIDFLHQTDGRSHCPDDLAVTSTVLPRESTPLAVGEPLFADAVAADVEPPHLGRYTFEILSRIDPNPPLPVCAARTTGFFLVPNPLDGVVSRTEIS